MELPFGQVRISVNDSAPPVPSPAAAAPAMPAPPAAPNIVIQRYGSKSDEDRDETVMIQGSPTHHSSSVHLSSGLSDVVPIVAIVFCFGWLSIKAIVNAFVGRGPGRNAKRLNNEEQAVLEKLQRTLAQMESRVESLETILVETRRAKESYGTKF